MDKQTEISAIEQFKQNRERLNQELMKYADTHIKRLFNLDASVYRQGALPEKTKELLGFVASLVLRCDECILYHLIQCYEKQVSMEELMEAMTIAWTVGGSITVPHLRRAIDHWLELTTGRR